MDGSTVMAMVSEPEQPLVLLMVRTHIVVVGTVTELAVKMGFGIEVRLKLPLGFKPR